MQFVRKIVESDRISEIIQLPDEMKHTKVELLVLPLSDHKNTRDPAFEPDNYYGIMTVDDVEKKIQAIRQEWDRS